MPPSPQIPPSHRRPFLTLPSFASKYQTCPITQKYNDIFYDLFYSDEDERDEENTEYFHGDKGRSEKQPEQQHGATLPIPPPLSIINLFPKLNVSNTRNLIAGTGDGLFSSNSSADPSILIYPTNKASLQPEHYSTNKAHFQFAINEALLNTQRTDADFQRGVRRQKLGETGSLNSRQTSALSSYVSYLEIRPRIRYRIGGKRECLYYIIEREGCEERGRKGQSLVADNTDRPPGGATTPLDPPHKESLRDVYILLRHRGVYWVDIQIRERREYFGAADSADGRSLHEHHGIPTADTKRNSHAHLKSLPKNTKAWHLKGASPFNNDSSKQTQYNTTATFLSNYSTRNHFSVHRHSLPSKKGANSSHGTNPPSSPHHISYTSWKTAFSYWFYNVLPSFQHVLSLNPSIFRLTRLAYDDRYQILSPLQDVLPKKKVIMFRIRLDRSRFKKPCVLMEPQYFAPKRLIALRRMKRSKARTFLTQQLAPYIVDQEKKHRKGKRARHQMYESPVLLDLFAPNTNRQPLVSIVVFERGDESCIYPVTVAQYVVSDTIEEYPMEQRVTLDETPLPDLWNGGGDNIGATAALSTNDVASIQHEVQSKPYVKASQIMSSKFEDASFRAFRVGTGGEATMGKVEGIYKRLMTPSGATRVHFDYTSRISFSKTTKPSIHLQTSAACTKAITSVASSKLPKRNSQSAELVHKNAAQAQDFFCLPKMSGASAGAQDMPPSQHRVITLNALPTFVAKQIHRDEKNKQDQTQRLPFLKGLLRKMQQVFDQDEIDVSGGGGHHLPPQNHNAVVSVQKLLHSSSNLAADDNTLSVQQHSWNFPREDSIPSTFGSSSTLHSVLSAKTHALSSDDRVDMNDVHMGGQHTTDDDHHPRRRHRTMSDVSSRSSTLDAFSSSSLSSRTRHPDDSLTHSEDEYLCSESEDYTMTDDESIYSGDAHIDFFPPTNTTAEHKSRNNLLDLSEGASVVNDDTSPSGNTDDPITAHLTPGMEAIDLSEFDTMTDTIYTEDTDSQLGQEKTDFGVDADVGVDCAGGVDGFDRNPHTQVQPTPPVVKVPSATLASPKKQPPTKHPKRRKVVVADTHMLKPNNRSNKLGRSLTKKHVSFSKSHHSKPLLSKKAQTKHQLLKRSKVDEGNPAQEEDLTTKPPIETDHSPTLNIHPHDGTTTSDLIPSSNSPPPPTQPSSSPKKVLKNSLGSKSQPKLFFARRVKLRFGKHKTSLSYMPMVIPLSSTDVRHSLNLSAKQLLFLKIVGIEHPTKKKIYRFVSEPGKEQSIMENDLLSEKLVYNVIVEDTREADISLLTDQEREMIESKFKEIDQDNSGEIPFDVARKYYTAHEEDKLRRQLQMLEGLLLSDPSREDEIQKRVDDAKKMCAQLIEQHVQSFIEADVDGSKTIDLGEFLLHEGRIQLARRGA